MTPLRAIELHSGAQQLISILAFSVRMPEHSVRTPEHSVRTPEHSVRTPEHSVRTPEHSIRTPEHSIQRTYTKLVMHLCQDAIIQSNRQRR